MKIALPSSRGEFAEFPEFYESNILPFLKEKEDARQQAVMHSGLIAIGVAVLAMAAFLKLPFGEDNFVVTFFIVIFGVIAIGWRLSRTSADITNGLLARICGQMGFEYRQKMGRPSYCEVYDRLKLLPNYNRESWEDEVIGERGGASFIFCEAHLKYKSSNGKNSSTRTVFHGQLLIIDYSKRFLGETVIKRDAGIFNRFGKPGKEFQQIGITSPKFEKIFEAWSTDQVEARELLDPLVLERFEELDRLFDGAALCAAFTGGKLYIAMKTGDKLNMGSMFKPLAGPERVEKILKEFDVIFDLMDVLLKRVDGKLDSAFSVDAVRGE